MPETEKLSAAQRSRVRRLSAPKELSPDEEGGELNIIPFLDIITNVLMFVLATIIGHVHHDDRLRAAARGRLELAGADEADLVAQHHRRRQGVHRLGLRPAHRRGVPGARRRARGRPADRAARDYDYSALTTCAKRLKNQVPEAADETAATLTANGNIPYQVIIGTVDAIRKSDDGQELFPDINFGVPK